MVAWSRLKPTQASSATAKLDIRRKARAVIELMKPALVGQDPLAIERQFYMMTATQYPYMAHVPTAGGVDIALWDLAGKITGLPVYKASRRSHAEGYTGLQPRVCGEHARPGRVPGVGGSG